MSRTTEKMDIEGSLPSSHALHNPTGSTPPTAGTSSSPGSNDASAGAEDDVPVVPDQNKDKKNEEA